MEQLLKSLPDENADGIPDALGRILNDGDFGLGDDKWKNRRKAVFWTLIVSGGSCFFMMLLWAWKLLFTTTDMPMNLLQFGTAIFYAMVALFTTVLLGYLGFSQADTNAYRKHSVDLAKSIPAPPVNNTPGAYGGYSPYSNQQFGQGYGYDPNLQPPVNQADMTAPPVPPTPVGPTERKPGVIL
jgi:hypothetical protein